MQTTSTGQLDDDDRQGICILATVCVCFFLSTCAQTTFATLGFLLGDETTVYNRLVWKDDVVERLRSTPRTANNTWYVVCVLV